MDWQTAIEQIKPYIVKVSTPQGTGTGFFLSHSKNHSVVGIATAAHVVNYAHMWEQPIRIEHYASGQSVLLRPYETDRQIFIEPEKDSAAVIFYRSNLPFPDQPLNLISEYSYLLQGSSLGWLGFPAVWPQELCFFTGTVSAYLESLSAYLVDGVIINGISGGPTFFLNNENNEEEIGIVGMVSAYLPNKSSGESLPGLGVVRDVSHLQQHVLGIASLEDTPAISETD